ncbi:MAG: PKD domain-containing protein [Tenuifilaceae bacterium]
MAIRKLETLAQIFFSYELNRSKRNFNMGTLKFLSLLLLISLFYSQNSYSQTTVELTTADIAVCPGATVNFTVIFTGGTAPFSVDYTYDGVTQTYSGGAPTANLSLIATNSGNITLSNPHDSNGNPLDDALNANFEMLVTINPLPTDIYIVGDPSICNGGSVNVSISGSQAGIRYDLFSPTNVLMGTQNGNGIGINISATPTVSGTYRVVATDITSGCSVELVDKANITVESLPSALLAVSNAAACSGNNANIVLTAAEANTSYQLRDAGNNPIGAPQVGPGNLTFTLIPAVAGNYNILATRTIGQNCQAVLTDISTVTVNPLPADRIITATNYCQGAINGIVTVPLAENTVSYRIYTSPGNVPGAVKVGTGVDLTWTGLPAGSYYIIATNTLSCTRTLNTVTVVQNPLPGFGAGVTADDYTLCTGASTQLHANATSAAGISSYLWTNGATLVTNTLENPIATPLNSTSYSVTVVDNNGCTRTSAPVSIIVNPTPGVTISPLSGSFTICEGSSISLRGESNPDAATWSWDGGLFAGVGDPPGDYVISPGSSTFVTLDIVDVNGCPGTASVNITVNETPTANAGPNRDMCAGVGTTLDASSSSSVSPITSYAWSNGGTAVTTFVNPAVTTTYSLTVTNALGCSDGSTVTVNYLTNPTITLTSSNAPSHSICNGSSINLIATPAGGSGDFSGIGVFPNPNWTPYNWMPGGLSTQTVNVSPPNTVLDAPPATQVYLATVTDSRGCKATGSITVTTFSQSDLTIQNDGDVYCQDAGNVPLVATPFDVNPAISVWSSTSAGLVNNAARTLDASYTPGYYNIDYTYTNSNGCARTEIAQIRILPYSTPILSITAPPNGSDYCNTGVTSVPVTAADNLPIVPLEIIRTFTITGGVGLTQTGERTADFDPSDATGAGVGTHTITYTVTSPGCANSASINVNVGYPVAIATINDMCIGDADQVLTIAPHAGLGTWTITFTPDATGIPVTVSYPEGDPLARLQATVPGNYSVDYELSVAACTNITTVTCRVNALPTLDFDIGTFNQSDLGINFCDNIAPVLLAPTPGGGSFSSSPVGNVNTTWFEPAVVGAGPYTLTYSFTHPVTGCSNSITSKIITVNAAPVVDIIDLDNLVFCQDEALISISGDPLSNTSGLFGTFTFPLAWTSSTEFVDNLDGTAEIYPVSVNPTGTFNISYTVADANGCSGSTTETFTIKALPTVDFNGIPASGKICKNATSITITGSPTSTDGWFDPMAGLTDHGDGTATFDPSTLTVGIHTITYNYSSPPPPLAPNRCTNTISKNIEVLSLPNNSFTVAALGPNGEYYCQNDLNGVPLSLTGSQATYRYDLIRNSTTTVSTFIPALDGPFTFAGDYKNGIYSVLSTDPVTGCAVLMGGTVTVVERPAVVDAGTIVGNVTVCADGATIYTYTVPLISNASSYIWNIPPDAALVSTIPPGNSITVRFNPTYTTGAISVYGTTGFVPVCSDGLPNSITVTKSSIPVDLGATISSSAFSFAGAYVVCEGETGVTFSVDPADFNFQTYYEWVTTSGVIMTDPSASSITIDFAAGNPLSITGVVSVRARNTCSPMSGWVTQAITVNPIPNVTINALGAGNVITCAAGSSVQLQAVSAEAPASITAWFWTAGGGGVIVPGDETVADPFVTNEGNFTVQIEVTNSTLACYNTATIAVGADKTAPVATINAHGVLDCNNTTLTLQANSTAPSSYLWTFTPPANIVGATNLDNPVVNQPGLYTVTVTDLSNSCTGSASTNVTRNTTPPNISVTNPAATQLTCIVNSVNVTGNSTTGGATYQWTTAIGGATIATPTNATTAVDMAGLYTLTVTNPANGCTASLPVNVNENKTIPTITALVNNDANPDITCTNTSVQLQATASAATATFAWSTLTGTIDAVTGAYLQFAEVSSAANYTVVATDPTNGCQSLTSTITVDQDFTAATTTGITSAGNDLTCTNSGVLNLVAAITGDAGGTYLWSGTGTLVPPLNAANVNVTSAGTITLTYRHSVTGCPTTANIVINNRTALPAVAINPGPYVVTCANVSATNAITPTITATGDANPLTTYNWSGPAGAVYSNQTALITTVDRAGTYTITATNPYGCIRTASVNVTSSLTAPNISVTDPASSILTCLAVTVNVSGGSTTPGATYLWTTGIGGATITNPTNATATVDMAGLYTLTVTNPANGCTSSLPVTVSENVTVPTITALDNNDTNPDLTCSNTSVQLQATASVPNATFVWNTITGTIDFTSGVYQQYAEVSEAANYTVIATDPANGCQSIVNTITVDEDLTTATTTNITSVGTELTCTNSGTLNLVATITGNAGGTYLWSGTGVLVPPLNAGNVNVTTAGTFTLTYGHSVTGCTTTATLVVTDRTALPTVTINPGPYVITCANVSATNAITPTITATGDANPLTTYLWTGPAGSTISNPTSLITTVDRTGTYTLTATNPYGCTNSVTVTVTSNLTPPNISVTNPASSILTCLVANIPVSGSSTTPAAAYHWTTAIVGATISTPNNSTTNVDRAGIYTLTVTNPANGCTASLPVTVNENKTVPTITALVNNDINPNITCGNPTVQLQATVVAVADASFSWSTLTGTISLISGAYNQYAEVSAAGTYTVTATHPISGCTFTDNINVVTDYSTPIINIVAGATTITCTNPTIILNGSTSVNATNFAWTYTAGGNITNGGNTNTATISTGATYTLTAGHTSTGCTANASIVIAENKVAPSVTVVGEPYSITCTNTSLVLSSVADVGSTVLWTGPGVVANANTLSTTINLSGSYRITATAANGCTSYDDVVVGLNNAIPAITVTQNPPDITCTNTSVTISGLSPVPGVTYSWTKLSGTAIITNPTLASASVNAAGDFRLTVTAPNGCTNSGDVTVGDDLVNPILTLPAVDDNELTCNQTTVILNGSSTTPNVLYSWSTFVGGATIVNGNSPTPTVDRTGNYTVVVTNPVNGCTTTGTTTVNGTFTTPTIVIAAPSGQITCATPTIQLDATGTTNASTYLWVASNGGHIVSGATTTQPVVDAAGRYTLTAYHTTTGCTITDFRDVTKDASIPDINIFDPFPAELTCTNTSVSLLADASALTTNKSILWTTTDGNITTATNITNPSVNQGGTYVVTITNTDNGCYSVRGVTVDQNITPPTIQINSPLDLTCTRLQVSLIATATSVDGSTMNYNWVAGPGGTIVSGSTTLSPIVSAVANYTLTVTDNGNGCTNSSLVSVAIDNAQPNVSVDVTPDVLTCTQPIVFLNGSSSTPNITYSWIGPGPIINSTTTSPQVSVAGTYNLVVTSLDNGCSRTSPDVVVTNDFVAPSITLNAPSGNITCSVSLVTISASYNAAYSYQWAGPGTIATPNSNSTTVNMIGTYTLAVTGSSNGCVSNYSVTVIEDKVIPSSPVAADIQTCFGTANPSFNATIGTNVRWYNDVTLGVFLGSGNSYTPTTTTAGTHNFYATSTGANGCVSLPTEVSLTINTLPSAPLTSGNFICEGSVAKTISAVGSNIKWYNNAHTFIINGSTYSPTDNLQGSYTYYATQTDINSCESDYRSATYTVYQVPLAPDFVDPTLEVCQSSANPIFTVTGSNIKWYKNLAGAVLSTNNTYQPLDVLPGLYTYYATQTANQCESTHATGTITINTLPSIYNVTGGGNYCQGGIGSAIGLSNSQTGVHYELWLDGSTIVADLIGTTGLPLNFGNLLSAGTYSVKAITASSCSVSMNGSVTISINPLPSTPGAISGQSTVCQGQTYVYTVGPIANATSYQWTVPAGMNYVGGSTTNTIALDVTTAAVSGTISVYGINSCGNGAVRNLLVTVNNLPSTPPIAGITGNTVVCEGQKSVTYTIAPITGEVTYDWTLLPGMTVVDGANTNTIVVNYGLNEGGGNIFVQGRNACGLGPKSNDLAITIKPKPTPLAIPDVNVCASSTTITTAPLIGTETGSWTVIYGSSVVQTPNASSSLVNSLRMGLNTLVWTISDNGCSDTDTVNVYNNITNVNAGTDQVICSTTVTLNAIYPATGATWTVISGSGVVANTTSPTTTVTQLAQDINRFAWQVNKSGCISRDTITIYNYKPEQPYAGIDQIVDVAQTTLDGSIPEVGTSGFWSVISGSGSFVNLNDPKTQVNGLLSGTNKLVWTVLRQSCSLTDTMKIENIMLDDPEAGVNQSICINSTQLEAIYPRIGTGEWSVMVGQATFVNPYSNTTKVTGLGYGNNWLKWTVRTSGIGMKYDSVLIVNNIPSLANAGPDLVVCVDNVNLMASTPLYGTGNWTLINGSGNVVTTNDPNSLFSTMGQGKNDLKWTVNNNGCLSEDFVSITNNIPTTAIAGLDQVICFDTATLYPNTPTIGIGSWSIISGSGAFTGNVVKNLAPDQNVLRYTITKGSCTSTDDVLITNNNPTSPSAGYDQNLCMPIASTTLGANQATQGNGVWTIISGSGTFSDPTTNNPAVTNIANGINIYRWTITKNGCTEQDEVIVWSNYIVATAGLDETLCNDNTQLRGSNPLPGVGTWSVVGNSAATFDTQNSPNSTVRNLSKGPNTLRWIVNNNGCVTSDDVQITNNKPTQSLAGENQAVCSKTANLFANQADPIWETSVWTTISGSAVFSDPTDSKATVTSLSGGQNVLRWTITMGSCISSDEVTVTSNLPTSVFAGNDQVACSNTAVLSANPPSLGTGQWSVITGAGSFVSRSLYNTAVNNLGQGDNIFKWTVSSADCHVSDTVVIRSSIPTRSIAGSNQIICSNSTRLGANTSLNGTGSWSIVSGSVDFTDRSSPTTTVNNIALGTNILAWIIDKDGCQSSSEITVTNNSPSTPNAGYDVNLCGDSTRLFADPPLVGTGNWTLVSGDAVIHSSNQNETRVTNIKFGPNTFRWTLTNKNCIVSDDVVITSDYAYVNAGADFEVNTSTAQLIGNKPSGGTGLWTLSAGQGTIESPSNFDTRVNNLGAGSNVFEWSITFNGCTARDAVVVNYIVWPIADFEPSSYSGCSPLEVNFVNTSIGGSPYSWNFGDGSFSSQPNIIHTFINPGEYIVKLTATAPLGNTVIKEKKIIVHGHPIANFDVNPKEIYIPGQYISCFNYSVYADSSYWDFGDGKELNTKFAPKYTYTDTGKFSITLKVLNTFKCADSMTINQVVHVKKRSGFFFPEAFTPNPNGSSGGVFNPQDRSNDVFFPIIIDGSISEFEFRVYNRSGVLIFMSTDANVGWDGYYKGKLQPQDVYIYKFSGRYNSGDPFQKVGNVLLIKKEK